MGSSHGIGVKRNAYHRRNRRRNISTFSTSSGVNYPASKQKAGEAPVLETSAVKPKYPGFNENVWTRSHRRSLIEAEQDADWRPECFIATSSLNPQRLIHIGPFSKLDEIKRQRFGNNPNDNWWLWEIRERVGGQSQNEFLSPVKKHSRPIDYR